jgi:DNA-binding NarL/FixJ family response regulator
MHSKGLAAARIVVADDHHLVRSALVDLLRKYSGFEVIGEAAHGQEALELCCRLKPDLVLMDVSMPEMDGIEAARAIRRELPQTVVLMMTASEEPRHLAEALEAGAAGYVLKTVRPQQLVNAIRRALEGETPLNQELSKEVILSLMGEKREEQGQAGNPVFEAPSRPSRLRSEPASAGGRLTPREVEVLRLAARGYTNQQIARELLISTSTAKNHLQRIFAKLGASDRTQAVVMAIESGLIPGT